jgi:hypothetical protein
MYQSFELPGVTNKIRRSEITKEESLYPGITEKTEYRCIHSGMSEGKEIIRMREEGYNDEQILRTLGLLLIDGCFCKERVVEIKNEIPKEALERATNYFKL